MHAQRDESTKTKATVIHLEGRFDRDAASALRRSLDALGSDADVVIDFSRVTDFRDLAIDALVRGLQAHSIHVRGLASHQERMFGYFGIRASSRAPRDDRADELDEAHPA